MTHYHDVDVIKYSLSDLKVNTGLRSCLLATKPCVVFDAILKRDESGKIITPSLICIGGSVTAGKTLCASELHFYLKERGIHSVIIHGDWFLASRKDRSLELERARNDSYSILSYDAMHCDFKQTEALLRKIFTFLKFGAEKTCTFQINGAYNRATGMLNDEINLTISKKSVVICEGTGLLGTEMRQYSDLSIRVDVGTLEETLKRLQEREVSKAQQSLPPSFLEERYRLIDLPYDAYLRARDKHNFDVLLDTTDRNRVKVYKVTPNDQSRVIKSSRR